MSEQMVDPFVRHALRDLFDPKGYFCICDFDAICRLLNVIPPKGHRDRLSLMHCVKYRDMDEELRQEVGRLVFETLNSPGFDIRIERVAELGKGKVRSITGRVE